MNSIFQALQSGYPPDEILNFLSKAIPQFSSSIMKAKKSGYAAKQILGFLSKSFGNENREGLSESERHGLNNKADAERTKFGLTVAASALAAPAALHAAQGAFARAIPRSLQSGLSLLQGAPNQIAGGVMTHSQPSSASMSKIPQTGTSQPTGNNNLASSLTNPSLTPVTNDLGSETNISENAINVQPNSQQIDESEKKRLEALEKFKGKLKEPSLLEKETERFQKGYSEEEIIEPEEEGLKEPEPIKKGSSVGTPNGIGNVKEIRNGKALVDVNGKTKQIPEEELISSPLPEEELANLYDEMIGGIEKVTGQQVSRNVDWAGFDPASKELLYKPHGSESVYAYDNISDEDVNELMSMLSQRKSTGQNFIGAWEAGTTSPIGAAMYQLIKKLQSERGGKGNEYKNKFQTIYEAIAPAKTAARKRHEERKRKAKKSGIA